MEEEVEQVGGTVGEVKSDFGRVWMGSALEIGSERNSRRIELA